MKLFNVYIFVFVIFTIFSCDQKEKVVSVVHKDKEVFDVVVTHSAGDRWNTLDKFLPLPMNVGIINGKEVLILSDRIDSKEKLAVKTLGAINIIENDSLKTYVLAIPNNPADRTVDAEGFDEFSTIQSSAKWIIEQYLLNRRGGYSTRLKSWVNEKSALNYLLN